MKAIILAAALLASSPAFAALASFTGRAEQIQTVTYQTAWRCEYNLYGQTFWMVFRTWCPSTVEVQ